MDNIVTIKVFNNTMDAYILKSKLESENINCFLLNENIGSLYPNNFSIGGIKLKISEHDIDKALDIIKEIKDSSVTDDENNIIQCPN